MALLSAWHSYTLPSTVIAISDVVPAHNEVKLLGHQWLYGANGREVLTIFAHAHPCPAVLTLARPAIGLGQSSRANQTNESTCTNLTSSRAVNGYPCTHLTDRW